MTTFSDTATKIMIASIGFICAGVILAVIYIFTMDNIFTAPGRWSYH